MKEEIKTESGNQSVSHDLLITDKDLTEIRKTCLDYAIRINLHNPDSILATANAYENYILKGSI